MKGQTLIYGLLIPSLIFVISFLVTYLLYKKFVKSTHGNEKKKKSS